jgi:hypothetical protein
MVQRRLRATITFEVDLHLDPGEEGPDSPVELAQRCKRELFGNPFAYWSAEELRGDQLPTSVVRVERHVEVEAAPVDELSPDQVGMRLAPRRPEGWTALQLAEFLDRRWVWFATLDGRQVTAEVASIGAWSAEVASEREQHPLGYGAYVSLWVPELRRFCWANPESLILDRGLQLPLLPAGLVRRPR